jgi:hypothetical protein
MIGNPIPDWNLGLSSYFQLRRFKVSFLLDFKKGGDIWNGTNAVLDYLGRSTQTGNTRNTANYVFDGVDVNGNINTIPLTFMIRHVLLLKTNGFDMVGMALVRIISKTRHG